MSDPATTADKHNETPTTHHTTLRTPKGPAPLPPDRNKRMLSPSSAEAESKKHRTTGDEMNRLICMERGMDYDIQSTINKDELQEKTMQGVQDSLKDCNLKNIEGQGTMIGVNDLMKHILPAFLKGIVNTLGQELDERFEKQIQRLEARNNNIIQNMKETMQARCLSLHYENDRLEQYTRRETVRVTGLAEGDTETVNELETKVFNLFKDAGANDITPADISTMHRVGSKNPEKGPRPILVKFISRQKKKSLLTKKKNLKEKPQYPKTYLQDDLTKLRSKLYYMAREMECVDKCWTIDGKIFAKLKESCGLNKKGQQKLKVIETPEDLTELPGAVCPPDYKELGLETYLFVQYE